jgi:thymidylate kinase
LLIENETSKLAIVDIGGLVQRLDLTWLTSTSIHEDEKEAIHLLNIMPLPAAVVYVHINTDTNVERLQNRKKTLRMHRSLSATELREFCGRYRERWEMVCGLLADRKIPVLKIDSGLEMKENVKKINEFAEALFAGSLIPKGSTKQKDILTSR